METDPDYGLLGPVAICAFITENYSTLIKDHDWPALTAVKPFSNFTPISSNDGDSNGDSNGGSNGGSNDGSNGGNGKRKQGDGQTGIADNQKWRYLKPSDENQVLKDGKGKE